MKTIIAIISAVVTYVATCLYHQKIVENDQVKEGIDRLDRKDRAEKDILIIQRQLSRILREQEVSEYVYQVEMQGQMEKLNRLYAKI
jgi:hypothetical protein